MLERELFIYKLMQRMKRKHSFAHLLLICLLFTASSQEHNCINIKVEAIQSVDFKLKTEEPKPQSASKCIFANSETRRQLRGKQQHNIPSGPNPVGNVHPPARP